MGARPRVPGPEILGTGVFLMYFEAQRREVAYFMRRLYRQKLTTTSGGNISVRVDEQTIAVTPAAIDKGRMRESEVALMTLAGEMLTPELKASSETKMHLRIYEECPHVSAIVHAHPMTASAFSASETPINLEILAESYAILGKMAIAPYALTGTPELADCVARTCQEANCVLMKNHGVVALGRTLLEAFDRLELIESAAQMTLIIRQLEGVATLNPEQRKDLDRLMGRK